MMVRTGILIAALALLAVAGCGGDETTAGGDGARLAGPIDFKVGGGEAPRLDEVTVQPDGSGRVKTMRGEAPFELTADELSELAEQIEAAGLPDIPEDSLSPEPVPDAPGYRLTYEGRRIDTDAPAAPEALDPLIGTFLGLIDRHAPK